MGDKNRREYQRKWYALHRDELNARRSLKRQQDRAMKLYGIVPEPPPSPRLILTRAELIAWIRYRYIYGDPEKYDWHNYKRKK